VSNNNAFGGFFKHAGDAFIMTMCAIGMLWASVKSYLMTVDFFNGYRAVATFEAYMMGLIFQYGQLPMLVMARRARNPLEKIFWIAMMCVFMGVDLYTNHDAYIAEANALNHTFGLRVIYHLIWTVAVLFEEVLGSVIAMAADSLNKALMSVGVDSVPALAWTASNAGKASVQKSDASAMLSALQHPQQQQRPNGK
jgi:hypothetical protein